MRRTVNKLIAWCAKTGVHLPAGFPVESPYVGTTRFPRNIQTDNYSCYARSVQATLRHFGRRTTYARILRELRTVASEGTYEHTAIRFMRRFRLRVSIRNRMTLTQMKQALARDAVVFAYLDGDHVGVVYGMSDGYVYIADPSLRRAPLGRIPKQAFLRRWDRRGLLVRG